MRVADLWPTTFLVGWLVLWAAGSALTRLIKAWRAQVEARYDDYLQGYTDGVRSALNSSDPLTEWDEEFEQQTGHPVPPPFPEDPNA